MSDVTQPAVQGFRAALSAWALREGRTVRFVDQGPLRHRDLLADGARDLADLKVDILFSVSTPATRAAVDATAQHGTPVVFALVSDPVGAGFAQSLRAPGGRVTGVQAGDASSEEDPHRLELLLLAAPGTKRVCVLYDPDDPLSVASWKAAHQAADSFGVTVVPCGVASQEDVSTLLAGVAQNVDALYVTRSLLLESLGMLLEGALKARLPLCVSRPEVVPRGAFMGFGADLRASGEAAARQAAQIAGGVKPGVLPIEKPPTLFVINLKTATSIGVRPPENILNLADTLVR
ncbi:MAG: ABC transporter substrate-binding protein [Desulfovibrionaceae bacterium]